MDDFIELVNTLNENESKEILKAFNYVKDKNTNNNVFTLSYAIGVASNLISNKLDKCSIIAGLLYPYYITNTISVDEINNQEVLGMLKSLENMNKFKISNREEQLSSIKNMFIAIAKDIRVIIIKLCIEQEKLLFTNYMTSQEIASFMKSCSDIYSPISAMLGISHIKNKLENACFKYYKPNQYAELKEAIEKYVAAGIDNLNFAIEVIKKELSPIIPNVKVYGRQKQLHSIAKKLQSKDMGINTITDIYGHNVLEDIIEKNAFKDVKLKQIVDILACRVLVNSVEECYSVLGKIYALFTPVGNFKDYIAHPKDNGYQSLHTIVKLPSGDPLEIQIRTFDMHTYAEYGFAAHWAYKEKRKVNESDHKINYIRQVMDYYKEKSSDELLDILKTDVYSGKIFVQSPMGKILEFPEGSTPIDFAYAIHSKIGDKCVGAKINGKMVPLSTPLNNGNTIEIITNINSKGPSRDWLKVVKTSGARSKINAFFKKEMKDENIKKGKAILDNQAKIKNVNLSKLLKDEYLDEVFDRYALSSIDDMYATVGYGGLTSGQILNKLLAVYKEKCPDVDNPKNYPDKVLKEYKQQGSISALGFSNLLTKFGKCCNPLPGDDIVGFISRGKGITVHRNDCPQLKNHEFDRLIECSWNKNTDNSFVGSMLIVTQNIAGVLSKISKKVTDQKINIAGIVSKNNSNGTTSINLQVNINKKQDLDELMEKIRMFSFVIDVFRT